MDFGFDSILVIVRRHDGPVGVSATPRFDSASAFYRCLLWVSWVDIILLHRRK
jgi:hypothetical protein